MASEEQISYGDSDLNGLVADDDFKAKNEVEELGSPDFDSYEFENEVEELGSPDFDDSCLYEKRDENGSEINPEQDEATEKEVREVKRVFCHVRHSAIRDYPVCLNMPRPDVVSGDRYNVVVRRDYPECLKRHRDDEEATSRKRSTSVIDPVYGYYDDVGLWDVCPFVEESLKSEKHMLPNAGLGLVKRRLIAVRDEVMDLEDRWRKLHKAEVELEMFRAELIRDQTKLVLEALD